MTLANGDVTCPLYRGINYSILAVTNAGLKQSGCSLSISCPGSKVAENADTSINDENASADEFSYDTEF